MRYLVKGGIGNILPEDFRVAIVIIVAKAEGGEIEKDHSLFLSCLSPPHSVLSLSPQNLSSPPVPPILSHSSCSTSLIA